MEEHFIGRELSSRPRSAKAINQRVRQIDRYHGGVREMGGELRQPALTRDAPADHSDAGGTVNAIMGGIIGGGIGGVNGGVGGVGGAMIGGDVGGDIGGDGGDSGGGDW